MNIVIYRKKHYRLKYIILHEIFAKLGLVIDIVPKQSVIYSKTLFIKPDY